MISSKCSEHLSENDGVVRFFFADFFLDDVVQLLEFFGIAQIVFVKIAQGSVVFHQVLHFSGVMECIGGVGYFWMIGWLKRESFHPFLPAFPAFFFRLLFGYPLGFLPFLFFFVSTAFIKLFLGDVDYVFIVI